MKRILLFLLPLLLVVGCVPNDDSAKKVAVAVNRQQEQYNIVQPVPAFDWSLERSLVIQLYQIRNMKAATHSVWRSDYGMITGDCPSIGFGIPYDTSLTNPLVATSVSKESSYRHDGLTSIGQPEPNGIYASTNTSATWVMCAGNKGELEPVYTEDHVTVYPYPVTVDYKTGRVIKAGESSVHISTKRS